MLFDEQRLASLPIKPEYKERIRIICSKQETQQQCQILAGTPDRALVEMFSQVEDKLGKWKQNGPPPELQNSLNQIEDQRQNGRSQQGQPPGAGGIGSLPQSGGSPMLPPQQAPVPQGMAPSQMSRTPRPMDVPSGGIGNVRR
jgi:hypothetical protein